MVGSGEVVALVHDRNEEINKIRFAIGDRAVVELVAVVYHPHQLSDSHWDNQSKLRIRHVEV